ncbi:MAG: hypothetical protein NTY14_06890 [Candidatus Omnitrophica bacterium]|nr:hypothetical protein [Candidatus Omnitrophota bacterium]
MTRNKAYLLFLIIGVAAGVSFGIIKARADSPEPPEVSKEVATVFYDEMWNCTSAVVSSETGYKNFDPHAQPQTGTAAKFEDDKIKVFPKFVVREWTVHGHIHFE